MNRTQQGVIFKSNIRNCKSAFILVHVVSLDVISLFTNAPVVETIEIIIDELYHHSTLRAPKIEKPLLQKLLHICTTKTPFNFQGTTYIQRDGVSMGSPLGPTIADFYRLI